MPSTRPALRHFLLVLSLLALIWAPATAQGPGQMSQADIDRIHRTVFVSQDPGAVTRALNRTSGDVEVREAMPAGESLGAFAADVPSEMTDLTCRCTLVITGLVRSVTGKMTADEGSVYTESDVVVNEVLKQTGGPRVLPRTDLLVLQRGARPGLGLHLALGSNIPARIAASANAVSTPSDCVRGWRRAVTCRDVLRDVRGVSWQRAIDVGSALWGRLRDHAGVDVTRTPLGNSSAWRIYR
jgi:hypothetical protein